MKLVNRPCPTCKEDTLHIGPKCNHCGYVHKSTGDVWRERRIRRQKQIIYISKNRGMPLQDHSGVNRLALMPAADFWAMIRAKRAERAKRWDERKQRDMQFTRNRPGDAPLFDRSARHRGVRMR